MPLVTPSGRKALTIPEKYKAQAVIMEAGRIRDLLVWQKKLIQLRIREADKKHYAVTEGIKKSVLAMTSAEAIISAIDTIGYNWARGEYQRILDSDAEQREAVAQFRTGEPKIKSKHD